ncbi:MAG: formylglycine-generating enzyme family protein [Kiritimatiellia bacterium]
MKTNKVLFGMMAVFLSTGAMAADPTISGVTVQQRWPWSRLVDIDYVLTCDPGESMDISIEAYDGPTLLTLPLSSLSGDLSNVQRGTRRIVWDPTMTADTNSGVLPQFRVALTPARVSLYMIVDLTKSEGDTGQTEYVYESDLTNGLWGAWVRNPVTNGQTAVQSVIWTGVTTNDIYKTDKLVLRRISKGEGKIGSSFPPTLSTTLTKDFYAGVFLVTQRQWERITGANPSWFNNVAYYQSRPVEQVSYNDIRGASNSTPASVNWPATGVLVDPSSFVGKLRTKTGLEDFDLPTETQWEYACRAGTTTRYNDGISGTLNTTSNAQIDVLGRYLYNGGKIWDGTTLTQPVQSCGPENCTAIVGTYLPNAWGLYDMHGSVFEWCLDWSATLEGGEDPKGAESGIKRVFKGGCWDSAASSCWSSFRNLQSPNGRHANYGFRLVRTLP